MDPEVNVEQANTQSQASQVSLSAFIYSNGSKQNLCLPVSASCEMVKGEALLAELRWDGSENIINVILEYAKPALRLAF